MLNTCEINRDNLFHFLKNISSFQVVEIMLHPAGNALDDPLYFESLDRRFELFLKVEHRKSEFDLCFNQEFQNYETTK